MWHIGAEREHHGEREEPRQEIISNHSDNIGTYIEKIIVEHRRTSSDTGGWQRRCGRDAG